MMTMNRCGWLVAGLLGLLFVDAATAADSGVVKVRKNVVYRSVGDRDLAMDVATPAGEGPFPAIVFIHGGGWIMGHRQFYGDMLKTAAARGFVAATITYRLAKTTEEGGSEDGFPAPLLDVKAAIRFLRSHAADYRIDSGRVAVWGDSAGGHLALLAGLTRPGDGFEESDRSSTVQAVVNFFGPTDLTALFKNAPDTRILTTAFLGGTIDTMPEQFRRASPITYVRGNDPPILTIHGTADKVVPIEQAHLLDRTLKAAGDQHSLLELSGAGHGFRGADAVKAHDAAFRFLKEELSPMATP